MAALPPSLPNTFKAISCAAPHAPWEVVTLPLRAPAPTEVLVRVHASGICNSDHFVKEGTWPGLAYPRIPGHEVVGRIAAVGPALLNARGAGARFAIGALVGVGWNGGYCGRCGPCRRGDFWTCDLADVTGFTFDGGHAEYVYVPETALVSIPEEALEHASYAELAPLFCAGATVFDAIRTSNWVPGDLCVVQGIGGLGHLAVQYAAKMGLKVIAVSSGASKRDFALSIGAHEYIDASSPPPPSSSSSSASSASASLSPAEALVAHLQSRGGARLIVCTAPYADQISALLPAVAKNGTITLVSAATDAPVKVQNLLLNMHRATLRGWCCGGAADMEQCVRFSTVSGVKSVVQEYSLEQYAAAYDGVVANKARFRNVIVFP